MIRRIALVMLLAQPATTKPFITSVYKAIQDAAITELKNSAKGASSLVIPGGIGALTALTWSFGAKKTTNMGQGSRAATGLLLGGLVVHFITQGKVWDKLDTISQDLKDFRTETKENFETTWAKMNTTAVKNSIKDHLTRKKDTNKDEQAILTWLTDLEKKENLTSEQEKTLVQLGKNAQEKEGSLGEILKK